MEHFTTYEVLELSATYWTDSGGHFMNFLAVFSAYLVAGYALAGIGNNAAWTAQLFAGPNASLIVYVSPAVQMISCMGAIAFAYSRAGKARDELVHGVRVDSDD